MNSSKDSRADPRGRKRPASRPFARDRRIFLALAVACIVASSALSCRATRRTDGERRVQVAGNGIRGEQTRSDGFIRREGRSLVLDGKEVFLRGICFGNFFWERDRAGAKRHHGEEAYAKVRAMGMNAVRYYLCAADFEDSARLGEYPEEGFAWLDANVGWARENGVYLILDMQVPPGGYQSNGEGAALWEDPECRRRLVALWTRIAERYRDETAIAGYDILNEPVVTKSPRQWEALAGEIVRAIRDVDRNHLVIVANTMMVKDKPLTFERARNFFIVDDENALYTFHFYNPIEYTHQLASWTRFARAYAGRYPDGTKTNLTVFNPFLRYVLRRDKRYLEYELNRMLAFGKRNNVPMYVGEFGAYRACYLDRGGLEWLSDTLDLFARYRLSFTYHCYRDAGFGIYRNEGGRPDPAFERRELTGLFTERLAGMNRD